jgi:predicted phosphodiesterase
MVPSSPKIFGDPHPRRPRRLWAISDLHLASAINRAAIEEIPDHGDDWIILCGDICETQRQLADGLAVFAARFAKIIWVPGNHELWAMRRGPLRGVSKYQAMVETAREAGAMTPEDPYIAWPDDPDLYLCPLFLLYDYSFRPKEVAREDVVAWAGEEGAVCADEMLLPADPFATREDWCAARLKDTSARLVQEVPPHARTILINHYPLRRDLIHIPRIPRFIPWCGTQATHDWHDRFRAEVCVSGHLHTRRTDYRGAARFEEVSLGYPKQWRRERGAQAYLRQIWPKP